VQLTHSRKEGLNRENNILYQKKGGERRRNCFLVRRNKRHFLAPARRKGGKKKRGESETMTYIYYSKIGKKGGKSNRSPN